MKDRVREAIFNLLGPLVNPAAAPFQLLGVGRDELRPLLAGALNLLGTRRALVVCGADGLDEVTLAGPTLVTEVRQDTTREFTWKPADFGLAPADLAPLRVAVEVNRELVRRADYADTTLHDGDKIEIVTLVGGG